MIKSTRYGRSVLWALAPITGFACTAASLGLVQPKKERFYTKILVHWEMSKLNSSDAMNHIFNQPLIPQNVEEFKTGRADMNAICYRIGCLNAIHSNKKFGIKKVCMVCRMAHEDFIKVKGFIGAMAFKPPLIKILFDRIRFIPYTGFPLLKRLQFDQFRDLFRGGEPIGLNFDSVMIIGFSKP